MNISFSVSGGTGLAEFEEIIQNRLPSALLDAAQTAAAAAKERCPKATGKLAESISAHRTQSGAEVAVGADYGACVEFGTYKTAAQPFLIPSVVAAEKEIIAAVSGGLGL